MTTSRDVLASSLDIRGLSFIRARGHGGIRVVRQNQRIIRCNVCDHPPAWDASRRRLEVENLFAFVAPSVPCDRLARPCLVTVRRTAMLCAICKSRGQGMPRLV